MPDVHNPAHTNSTVQEMNQRLEKRRQSVSENSISISPGVFLQRIRLETRDHDAKTNVGILLLAKHLVRIEEGLPTRHGTIFPVSDDIPEQFDPNNPPQGISKNSREAKLLNRLYNSNELVMNAQRHKRAERDEASERKRKARDACNRDGTMHLRKKRRIRRHRTSRVHVCVDETCLASFNKGFNANRHFYTQHIDTCNRSGLKRTGAIKSAGSKSMDSSQSSSKTTSEEENAKSMTNMERTSIQALCFAKPAALMNNSDLRKEERMKETFNDVVSDSKEVCNEIREGAMTLIKLKYHNPDTEGVVGPRTG